ncbi:MAG TPA: radical SAM family heme chaperone HemW [Candidatus Eisenbacteria bacterium]|nr:radical SAM family heme chaperone HemW [Candidatus Eisenbacteria bacterium]
MSEGFALYVHVPWCRHVCPYCDFNVYAHAAPPEADYTAMLVRELATWTERAPWRGRRATSIFFGGGTPSLFTPQAIARVVDAAARCCGIEERAEITLEANPGGLDAERLRGFRRAGVTRLSLGVQSFQERLLRALGRDHTPDDARAAVRNARAAGFADLSLDLIFAVPGGDEAEWAHDLDEAIALAPDHVSAYALTFESATPYHAWRASGRIRAVDEDVEATMAELAAARLPAAGYERYEISSWARPDHASRHNQRYWDGSWYLGIGAGAHAFDATPDAARRWSNVRHPRAYADAVAARGTAVAEEHPLTVDEARADFVFTGLRRIAGVAATAFAARFGVGLAKAFPHVTGLVRDDLLEWAGDRLRLSARGLRFADTVAATFV